jgi:hypothetical protein
MEIKNNFIDQIPDHSEGDAQSALAHEGFVEQELTCALSGTVDTGRFTDPDEFMRHVTELAGKAWDAQQDTNHFHVLPF